MTIKKYSDEELEKDLIEHPEKINKKLFRDEGTCAKNVASIYGDSEILLAYANRNNLREFKEFYKKNREETSNRMLFEVGLINSDHLIDHWSIGEVLRQKEGHKHLLKPESAYEITKILIKNNEYELLSGIHNPTIKNNLLSCSKNEFSLPFQVSPTGINTHSHSFKFNYTIDYAKNQKTKDELTKIRDKKVKKLFFDPVLKKEIINFLEVYVKNEVILRKNGIKGNDLLEKIRDFDFMGKNFSNDLKKFDDAIYKTQFEQQGKILSFISKEPKPYLELINGFY